VSDEASKEIRTASAWQILGALHTSDGVQAGFYKVKNLTGQVPSSSHTSQVLRWISSPYVSGFKDPLRRKDYRYWGQVNYN